jgi:hypothetical protein
MPAHQSEPCLPGMKHFHFMRSKLLQEGARGGAARGVAPTIEAHAHGARLPTTVPGRPRRPRPAAAATPGGTTHPSALVSGRAWKPKGLSFLHALRSCANRALATPDMSRVRVRQACQVRERGPRNATGGSDLGGGGGGSCRGGL